MAYDLATMADRILKLIVINILYWCVLTVLSNVFSCAETTMGVQINAQGNPDSPFLKAMSTALELICQRIFHLWLQPDWLYSLFPQYKTHQKCIGLLHDFTDDVSNLIYL